MAAHGTGAGDRRLELREQLLFAVVGRSVRPLAAPGRDHIAAGADRDDVELALLRAARGDAQLAPPRADVVRVVLVREHVLAADALPARLRDERVELRQHRRAQVALGVRPCAQPRAIRLDEAKREVEEAVADRVARALRSRARGRRSALLHELEALEHGEMLMRLRRVETRERRDLTVARGALRT